MRRGHAWYTRELILFFSLRHYLVIVQCSIACRCGARVEMEPEMNKVTTFEQGYRQYPFSELVRLSIGFGKWIAHWRAHRGATALSMGEIYSARVQGMATLLPLRTTP